MQRSLFSLGRGKNHGRPAEGTPGFDDTARDCRRFDEPYGLGEPVQGSRFEIRKPLVEHMPDDGGPASAGGHPPTDALCHLVVDESGQGGLRRPFLDSAHIQHGKAAKPPPDDAGKLLREFLQVDKLTQQGASVHKGHEVCLQLWQLGADVRVKPPFYLVKPQ